MKRLGYIATLVAVATFLLPLAGKGATRESTETWDTGTTEAWIRHDPLNVQTGSLANPGTYLEVVFNAQSMPVPEINIVLADTAASGGDFAGGYWDEGVTNISLKVYCESNAPADMRLYLVNATNDNWWHYPLDAPAVGEWTDYSVSLDHSSGWQLPAGGDSAQFKQDLRDIKWVGISIERNIDLQQQAYGLDSFVLHGVGRSDQSDGDGMSDWEEFLAGTDEADPDSVLRFKEVTPTNSGTSVILRWTSEADRTYRVKRFPDVSGQPGETIANGVQATPPVNMLVAPISNGVPHFFGIELED